LGWREQTLSRVEIVGRVVAATALDIAVLIKTLIPPKAVQMSSDFIFGVQV
jgi:hypothetical protein